MPRTSRPRASASSDAASHIHPSVKNAMVYYSTSITILWVVVMALSISVWLVLLFNMLRLDRVERALVMLGQEMDQLKAQQVARPAVPSPVAVSSTIPQPLPVSAPNVSPSGALDRGSLLTDGSRYAGYDDATKGKIGIGVEIAATKQIKHIVIFNPYTESTGKGTMQESTMSVRWKDEKTIEYDILVKKNNEWIKEVQSVKIYF